jgi:hypothetical protein
MLRYPAVYMRKDEGDDRLHLHMAILKGAFMDIIRYLLEAYPVVLEKADSEGSLPSYSSEPIIRRIAESYPNPDSDRVIERTVEQSSTPILLNL